MKTCKHCGARKDTTEFYKCKLNRDGLHSWCKSCVKARATKTIKDHNYKHQRDYHNRTKPYVYELTDNKTGEFYIGSTKKKWCARGSGHSFLEGRDDVSFRQTFFDTIKEARGAETILIAQHIDNPLCANKKVTNKKLVGTPKPRKYNFRSKEIYQLNEMGKVIREWSSVKEAAETLGLLQGGISRVLSGVRETYKGTRWKTKTYYEPQVIYEVNNA